MEVPFTDRRRRVQRPGGRATSTSATCPCQDVTKATTNPLVPAANNPRLSDFTLAPLYTWSGSTTSPTTSTRPGTTATPGRSSSSSTSARPFQTWSTSRSIINKVFKGYGVPTYGPVPVLPADPFVLGGREDQPLPLQPVQGQEPALEPRLEGGPDGHLHLHRARAPAPTSAAPGSPPGPSSTFNLQYASGNASRRSSINDREVVVGAGRHQHHPEPRRPSTPSSATPRPAPRRRAAPGSSRTGAAAGSTPRTTTPPVRRSSPPGRGRTPGATATPPTTPDIKTTNHQRHPRRSTRTTWPSSCRSSGSPTR